MPDNLGFRGTSSTCYRRRPAQENARRITPARRSHEILERKVESLEQLPGRLDALALQVSQLARKCVGTFLPYAA
jgi:hypothetical protein